MRITDSHHINDLLRESVDVMFAVDVKDNKIIDTFPLGEHPLNLYSEYDPIELRRWMEACFIFNVTSVETVVVTGKGGMYRMKGRVYASPYEDECLTDNTRANNFMSVLKECKGIYYLRLIKNNNQFEFALNGT